MPAKPTFQYATVWLPALHCLRIPETGFIQDFLKLLVQMSAQTHTYAHTAVHTHVHTCA